MCFFFFKFDNFKGVESAWKKWGNLVFLSLVQIFLILKNNNNYCPREWGENGYSVVVIVLEQRLVGGGGFVLSNERNILMMLLTPQMLKMSKKNSVQN